MLMPLGLRSMVRLRSFQGHPSFTGGRKESNNSSNESLSPHGKGGGEREGEGNREGRVATVSRSTAGKEEGKPPLPQILGERVLVFEGGGGGGGGGVGGVGRRLSKGSSENSRKLDLASVAEEEDVRKATTAGDSRPSSSSGSRAGSQLSSPFMPFLTEAGRRGIEEGGIVSSGISSVDKDPTNLGSPPGNPLLDSGPSTPLESAPSSSSGSIDLGFGQSRLSGKLLGMRSPLSEHGYGGGGTSWFPIGRSGEPKQGTSPGGRGQGGSNVSIKSALAALSPRKPRTSDGEESSQMVEGSAEGGRFGDRFSRVLKFKKESPLHPFGKKGWVAGGMKERIAGRGGKEMGVERERSGSEKGGEEGGRVGERGGITPGSSTVSSPREAVEV